MKKIIGAIAAIAILTMSVGAFAQTKASGLGGGARASASAATKLNGIVKGAPSGKTFTLAMRGKPAVKVDASKATFRMNGKFASIKDLKGGSIVSVEGATMGDHFMASKVDIKSTPGMKKSEKKGS